mgnify:FL=1
MIRNAHHNPHPTRIQKVPQEGQTTLRTVGRKVLRKKAIHQRCKEKALLLMNGVYASWNPFPPWVREEREKGL